MKPGDPVSEGAERAIEHLISDHPEALLDMAPAIGGCPEGPPPAASTPTAPAST